MKSMLRQLFWAPVPWLVVMLAVGPAAAQDKGRNAPATAGDISRLENEIREQRTMILRMLKVEQERSELMLRLLEGRCGPGGSGAADAAGRQVPIPPEIARAGSGSANPSAASDAPAEMGGTGSPSSSGAGTATVRGKVQGPAKIENVYVYLDGMRSSGKGKSIEIVQKNKQFVPGLSVAVAGTKVTFPNRDVMFHNVFSPSPKPFDLGTRGGGDAGATVELDTTGVVEIYCNIHSKMNARILVVPSRVYAPVNADGTFRLEKVPVGKRKLVVWGPGFKAQRREVDVSANGAEATFNLEAEPYKAHPNKMGMPYGSYKE
jgi:plastocyanin